MTKQLFLIFLISAIINFVYSISIVRELGAKGIKVGFYELRWQVHKHLKTYRKVTTEKYGKVAFPFYGYIVSLVSMLLSGAMALASMAR